MSNLNNNVDITIFPILVSGNRTENSKLGNAEVLSEKMLEL